MRTIEVTRGPYYDAKRSNSGTLTLLRTAFTSYFLQKLSWVAGKSFVAVYKSCSFFFFTISAFV